MTSAHPAMTRILEVIERLSEHPYRTNFVLLGEPGTGKEGLARALAHLTCPGGPLVRFDAAGFPEADALAMLCGTGRRGGIAEAADGGTILIEEAAGLGARVQATLLRLLKSGRCERLGTTPIDEGNGDDSLAANASRGLAAGRRFDVRVIAMSDRDLPDEAAAGKFRHDLYYRLARVVLTLPPLRERKEDIAPSVIWMGNRILRAAGAPFELLSSEDYRQASPEERGHAIALDPSAVQALQDHTWPGNFRELEAVLERALLMYRRGGQVTGVEIRAALDRGQPPD